ncbi:transposase [Patescibacteria group bacterium]|nr:transposase [Patescibacteria group bacterium]
MHGFVQRKHIRLQEHDYSSDCMYFLTICTKDQEHIFGEIAVGAGFPSPIGSINTGKFVEKFTYLSEFGHIAQKEWCCLPDYYPFIKLYEFVVMPNHIHGIIEITHQTGDEKHRTGGEKHRTGGETPPLREVTLGQIIAYYKYQTTKQINVLRKSIGFPVWQRNYYEHIIRD